MDLFLQVLPEKKVIIYYCINAYLSKFPPPFYHWVDVWLGNDKKGKYVYIFNVRVYLSAGKFQLKTTVCDKENIELLSVRVLLVEVIPFDVMDSRVGQSIYLVRWTGFQHWPT